MAPQEHHLPEARPKEEPLERHHYIAHPAHPSTPETPEERRLRALEDRYRNELMGEEERLELRESILKLRRKLETPAETVDAQHSCLESLTTSSNL